MLRRLIRWLLSFFRKGIEEAIWTPEERQIFTFFDGTFNGDGSKHIRKVDPMSLFRKYADIVGDLNVEWSLSESKSKDANKGYDKKQEYLFRLFDVKPFDGDEGLTNTEIEDLFFRLFEWEDEVKKNSRTSLITSDSPEDSSEPSDEHQPMSSTLPSGSSATEKSTETPPPSPSEPESPSVPSNPDSNTGETLPTEKPKQDSSKDDSKAVAVDLDVGGWI